ncbi:MAG: NADH-quinone oxidoreductase subunit L [Acidobacteriota bacterium]|nr:NADH-quinone oxidoreductase subunit L [Acidobacteriota bacterium]
MITLFIALPLAVVLILNLLPRKLADAASLWCGIALTLLSSAYILVLPHLPESLWRWISDFDPVNRVLHWQVTPSDLMVVMFLAIALVVFSAFWVGRYLISDENRRFVFNNLLILCMAGMNGIVLSNDLFTLYVFLEIVAAASFVLIALERTNAGLEGAFKYVLLSAVATVLVLSSMALIFMLVGSLDYGAVNAFLTSGQQDAATSRFATFAIGLFVVGLFIKGGIVPFHGWLPDAYSAAPTASSVLLGGIVTKAAGVFTLIQLTRNVFGLVNPSTILLVIGTLSIAVGAFAALGQKNFKRMLAYSSISQIGYIIIGLGAANEIGYVGAILHLFNHSTFKTLLFVNSAAVEKQTGTVDMDKLGGLSSKMPVTGFTSVLAFLSTAGVPPLSGFWSKLLIVLGVWQAGAHVLAVVAILLSVVTLAYFLSMQRRVFFGKLASGLENVCEANGWALVPAIILAAITLGLGLTIPWLFNTFLVPIESLWSL